MTLLTLLLITAVIAHMAQSIKLAESNWMIHNADGTIEYKSFAFKTMTNNLKRESGEVYCRKYIYQIGLKKKTSSILNIFTSMGPAYGQSAIASSSLIHKKSEEWLIEEFTTSGLNVSWTRVDSIPHNNRCYTASYAVTAQPLNVHIGTSLTSIDNIGLVVQREGSYYVVNELNGYNVTIRNDLRTDHAFDGYTKLFASFSDDTVWWSNDSYGNRFLLQTNSSAQTLIDVGGLGMLRGGVAVSRSVLMIHVYDDNYVSKIVKYDVESRQMLTSKTITSRVSGDIAISRDKSTVYYATNEEGTIHALSSGDLSMMRSYSISQFPFNQDTQYIYGIEVTSTAMWIYIDFESQSGRNPLARVTLNEVLV